MGFARLFRPTLAGANMGHPSKYAVACTVDSTFSWQQTCLLRRSEASAVLGNYRELDREFRLAGDGVQVDFSPELVQDDVTDDVEP